MRVRAGKNMNRAVDHTALVHHDTEMSATVDLDRRIAIATRDTETIGIAAALVVHPAVTITVRLPVADIVMNIVAEDREVRHAADIMNPAMAEPWRRGERTKKTNFRTIWII
jgi:hypothetical protein